MLVAQTPLGWASAMAANSPATAHGSECTSIVGRLVGFATALAAVSTLRRLRVHHHPPATRDGDHVAGADDAADDGIHHVVEELGGDRKQNVVVITPRPLRLSHFVGLVEVDSCGVRSLTEQQPRLLFRVAVLPSTRKCTPVQPRSCWR